MASFYGSVRLDSDPETLVRAMVEVDDDQVALFAGDSEIGRWSRSAVSIVPAGDRYILHADGERLVLELEEVSAFGAAVGHNAAAQDGAQPPETAGVEPTVDRPSRPPEETDAPEPVDAPSAEPAPSAKDLEGVAAAGMSAGFTQLRRRSVESYTEDNQLDSPVAMVLAGAAAVLLLGAILTWGADARLLSDGFPLARSLAAIGALFALVGVGIGVFNERRRMGAWGAIGGGVLALSVLFFAAREAGLGIGFLLAIVAALAVSAIGAYALSDAAAAPPLRRDENEDS